MDKSFQFWQTTFSRLHFAKKYFLFYLKSSTVADNHILKKFA